MISATRTAGWICGEPAQAKVVANMLEIAPKDTSPADADDTDTEVYHGRIELANIVVIGPAHSSGTRPVSDRMQRMFARLPTVQAIVITTVGAGPLSDTSPADVLISPCFGGGSFALALRRAIDVLRAEVGGSGYWLVQDASLAHSSCERLSHGSPRLHYLQNFEAVKELGVMEGASPQSLTYENTAAVLLVIGVSSKQPSRDQVEAGSFRNAALCAKELLQLAAEPSVGTISSLDRTERVVPARKVIQLPPFPVYNFPMHGKTVLLVITTENKHKLAVLQECIVGRVSVSSKIYTIAMPGNSDVGEQPYNAAGAEGAYNRIRNSLNRLQSLEFADIFATQAIGMVVAASIENYIQTQDMDRPVDFGIIIIHNATTNRTVACSSRGVTISREYVDRAQRFGTDGNANHGNVTVGKVLAARIPGLDDSDWHKVLAGLSRYDLLREAIAELQVPL